jgi:multidrug resistance efflux pump
VRGAHARDLRDRIAALGDVASGAERSTAEHDAAAALAQAASARGHSAERAADASLLEWRIGALEVRAEIGGRVAAEYARPGDAIEAGEPILRIVSDEVSLRFAVPASEASRVAVGRSVAIEGSEICAIVRRVAPEIDRAGLVLVETDPIATGAPVPGSVVRVRAAACGGES